MRWCIFIALAVALLIACVLVNYSLFACAPGYSTNYCSTSLPGFWQSSISYFSHFLLIAAKTNHFPSNFARRKKLERDCKGAKLSVFKGREAKLNRAIFLALFQIGPLVVYDITKAIKKRKGYKSTRYRNVHRRVRALMEQGYLESAGSRVIQSGFYGTLYQPTIRAKVAFYFYQINPDQFVKEANDEALTTELAALMLFFEATISKQ